MVNTALIYGILIEISVGLIASYVWWLGVGLSSRPVASPHFFVPAFCFFVLLLTYDEVRKVLLRRGIDKS
jgi:hypothetical protein